MPITAEQFNDRVREWLGPSRDIFPPTMTVETLLLRAVAECFPSQSTLPYPIQHIPALAALCAMEFKAIAMITAAVATQPVVTLADIARDMMTENVGRPNGSNETLLPKTVSWLLQLQVTRRYFQMNIGEHLCYYTSQLEVLQFLGSTATGRNLVASNADAGLIADAFAKSVGQRRGRLCGIHIEEIHCFFQQLRNSGTAASPRSEDLSSLPKGPSQEKKQAFVRDMATGLSNTIASRVGYGQRAFQCFVEDTTGWCGIPGQSVQVHINLCPLGCPAATANSQHKSSGFEKNSSTSKPQSMTAPAAPQQARATNEARLSCSTSLRRKIVFGAPPATATQQIMGQPLSPQEGTKCAQNALLDNSWSDLSKLEDTIMVPPTVMFAVKSIERQSTGSSDRTQTRSLQEKFLQLFQTWCRCMTEENNLYIPQCAQRGTTTSAEAAVAYRWFSEQWRCIGKESNESTGNNVQASQAVKEKAVLLLNSAIREIGGLPLPSQAVSNLCTEWCNNRAFHEKALDDTHTFTIVPVDRLSWEVPGHFPSAAFLSFSTIFKISGSNADNEHFKTFLNDCGVLEKPNLTTWSSITQLIEIHFKQIQRESLACQSNLLTTLQASMISITATTVKCLHGFLSEQRVFREDELAAAHPSFPCGLLQGFFHPKSDLVFFAEARIVKAFEEAPKADNGQAQQRIGFFALPNVHTSIFFHKLLESLGLRDLNCYVKQTIHNQQLSRDLSVWLHRRLNGVLAVMMKSISGGANTLPKPMGTKLIDMGAFRNLLGTVSVQVGTCLKVTLLIHHGIGARGDVTAATCFGSQHQSSTEVDGFASTLQCQFEPRCFFSVPHRVLYVDQEVAHASAVLAPALAALLFWAISGATDDTTASTEHCGEETLRILHQRLCSDAQEAFTKIANSDGDNISSSSTLSSSWQLRPVHNADRFNHYFPPSASGRSGTPTDPLLRTQQTQLLSSKGGSYPQQHAQQQGKRPRSEAQLSSWVNAGFLSNPRDATEEEEDADEELTNPHKQLIPEGDLYLPLPKAHRHQQQQTQAGRVLYPPASASSTTMGSTSAMNWDQDSKKNSSLYATAAEKHVAEYLRAECQSLGRSDLVIQWVNEHAEMGLPYDIVLLQQSTPNSTPQPVRYIEVKSSSSSNKKTFEMSLREFAFAVECGGKYEVYRLASAQQLLESKPGHHVKMQRISDPIGLWRGGALHVAGTAHCTVTPATVEQGI